MNAMQILKGLIMATMVVAGTAVAEIGSAEHWVENGPVKLYGWEKFSGVKPSGRVVVLAHGSATAGKESFDLQVPAVADISLMDVLARQRFNVFALDTRTFGRTTHPEGHMATTEASSDLQAVINPVARLRVVDKVDLFAWSWSTQ